MKTIIRFEPLLGGYLIMDAGEMFLIKEDNIQEVLAELKDYLIIKNDQHPKNSYSAPVRVQIQVTPFCNLSCLTCAVPEIRKDNKLMSSYFLKELFHKLRNYGVLSLEWSGGEPMVRKDFQIISNYAFELGFNQNILTNGLMIGRESIDFLIRNFYQLQISMDGIGELYNIITGRPAWSSFLSSLDIALESYLNSKLTIAVVVQEKNADDIYSLVEFCHQRGVRKIRISPQVPIGRSGMISWTDYAIVINRFRKQWPKIKDYALSKDMIISCFLDKPLIKDGFSQEIISLVSPGGYSFLYINAYGEMYPFPFLSSKEFYLGSIYKDDFSKVWNDSIILNKLRGISYATIGCGGCLSECSFADRYLVYAFTGDICGKPLPHKECSLNLTERR